MKAGFENYRQLIEQHLRQALKSKDSGDWNVVYGEFQTLFEELLAVDLTLDEQNQQLLHSYEVIESERKRFRDLYDRAPQAYLVTDSQARIHHVNLAAADLLGYPSPDLIQRPLQEFITQYDELIQTILQQEKTSHDTELTVNPRNGPPVDAIARVSRLESMPEEGIQLLWILTDVTRLKQAQRDLERSEERFRLIFDSSPIGIALLNQNTEIVDINPSLLQIIGWDHGIALETHFTRLVFREDCQSFKNAMVEQWASQSGLARVEARLNTCSGGLLWAALDLGLLHPQEDEPLMMVMVIDRTAEKQVEAIRAELQRHLLDQVEAERKHLARELHDRPLQDLYAVLYSMERVRGGLLDEGEQKQFAEAQASVQAVINRLRKMCTDLRPPSLMRYGLANAIRAYVDDVSQVQPGLQVTYAFPPELPELPERVALAFYRGTQVAVMNTLRHASATFVNIRMDQVGARWRLLIQDDGRGFEVPKSMLDLLRDEHYGLASISERAEAIDGRLEIFSEPGQGTRIEILTAPLHKPDG